MTGQIEGGGRPRGSGEHGAYAMRSRYWRSQCWMLAVMQTPGVWYVRGTCLSEFPLNDLHTRRSSSTHESAGTPKRRKPHALSAAQEIPTLACMRAALHAPTSTAIIDI